MAAIDARGRRGRRPARAAGGRARGSCTARSRRLTRRSTGSPSRKVGQALRQQPRARRRRSRAARRQRVRAARAQRRRQDHAARHPVDAGAADRAARSAIATATARCRADERAAPRDRRARPRRALLRRAHRRREPALLRRALRRRRTPRRAPPRCSTRSASTREARAAAGAHYSRGMLQRLALARALLHRAVAAPPRRAVHRPRSRRRARARRSARRGQDARARSCWSSPTTSRRSPASPTTWSSCAAASSCTTSARRRRLRRTPSSRTCTTVTRVSCACAMRPGRTTGSMAFLRHAGAVAWKDLRVELRSREIVYTMVFFAALLVVVFSFAFLSRTRRRWSRAGRPGHAVGRRSRSPARSASAARSTASARTTPCARCCSSPVAAARGVPRQGRSRSRCSCSPSRSVVVPLLALLLRRAAVRRSRSELAVAPGRSARSASRSSARCSPRCCCAMRSRDVLLPVMLYPILVPLFIAGTKATAALLRRMPDLDDAWFWIQFLGVYDAALPRRVAVDLRVPGDRMKQRCPSCRVLARAGCRRAAPSRCYMHLLRARRSTSTLLLQPEDLLLPRAARVHAVRRGVRVRRRVGRASSQARRRSGTTSRSPPASSRCCSAPSCWSPARSGPRRRGARGGSGSCG